MLDYWVAKAEGKQIEWITPAGREEGVLLNRDEDWPHDYYEPSTDWFIGGPIIERHICHLECAMGIWTAEYKGDSIYLDGPTPLIAAMRCYVASRFGEEISEGDDTWAVQIQPGNN